jgi:serine/threonine-protein kinase RsbW
MSNESVTVHSNNRDIRIPCNYLRIHAQRVAVPEEIINMCELALQELLTNLVDHAYSGNPNKLIEVMFSITSEKIIIRTYDTGVPPQINLDAVQMPSPEDLAEGGYGIAIIKSVMDEVNYFTSNGTNTWELVKNLK